MQKYSNNIQDATGRAIQGASVTVTTLAGAPAIIYSDNGVTTQFNPIITNALGGFSFYAADGRYSLSILSGGLTTEVTDILLEDPLDGSDAVFNDVSAETITVDDLTANNLVFENVVADTLAVETLTLDGVNLASSDGSSAIGFIQSGTGAVARTVQDKARETVSVKDFGAVGDGVTDDTIAIQNCIDYLLSLGGGTAFFPDGDYLVSTSVLSDTFSNDGVDVPASECSIVLWKNVSLVGQSEGGVKITTALNTKIILAMIAAERCTVRNIEIAGAWSPGEAGAGMGIFSLATAGMADAAFNKNTFENLYIHDVASYGIGLQNGIPVNNTINNVIVENTGADGLDLKARSDSSIEPTGNFCSNIIVRNHGNRVTGSAGLDIRGIWHLSNISVTDFGADNALTYEGIRFRTKPPITDPYNKAAARSTLTGFYIKPLSTYAGASLAGLTSGSDDIAISNGLVDGCQKGYSLGGNAVGSAERNKLSNLTAVNCTTYGFELAVGVKNTVLTNCITSASGTAGFRNAALNSQFINCQGITETTPISTAGVALPSEILIGCLFGANEYGISIISSIAGRVNMAPKGNSANIDIEFSPKGTGVLRFGTLTANADAPVTGYITIKDSGGVTRKLAVIA